jgi:hypothetical protein
MSGSSSSDTTNCDDADRCTPGLKTRPAERHPLILDGFRLAEAPQGAKADGKVLARSIQFSKNRFRLREMPARGRAAGAKSGVPLVDRLSSAEPFNITEGFRTCQPSQIFPPSFEESSAGERKSREDFN